MYSANLISTLPNPARLLLVALVLIYSPSAMSLEFSLFGDVRLRDSDLSGDTSDFALGQLDLFASQSINDRTTGFLELVVEYDDSFIVDIERLWIKYAWNDHLQFAAGRFHAPLGRWNRTMHHGLILQDTISRPFFLSFEDESQAILSMHLVGVMFTGEFDTTPGRVNYELAIGNGPNIDTVAGLNPTPSTTPEIDMGTVNDANNNKSVVLRLAYRPTQSDLQLGVFANKHKVAEHGENSTLATTPRQGDPLVDQTVYGFDFEYEYRAAHFLGEYFRLKNDNQIGVLGNYTADAFYLQGSYAFTPAWKLTYRYAALDTDANDAYFAVLGVQKQIHHVLTARWDLDESNAIMLEFNRQDHDDASIEDFTTYTLNWSFLLP